VNSSAIRLTRFLTPPPDGGFVRNDNINKFKILSFRALARNRVPIYRDELTEGNLIINYFKIIINNRYSNLFK
jgi:hypothetical protein